MKSHRLGMLPAFSILLLLVTTGRSQDGPSGSGTARGLIRWNDRPMAGVIVSLCSDYDCKEKVYKDTADSEGEYAILRMPSGKYQFHTQIPHESRVLWLNLEVQLKSGQDYRLRTVDVEKKDLSLLWPVGGLKIPTLSPILSWEAYSGAAYYSVSVLEDDSGAKAVAEIERTTMTEYAVDPPLIPGRYFWDVAAYSAKSTRIASQGGTFTTPKER